MRPLRSYVLATALASACASSPSPSITRAVYYNSSSSSATATQTCNVTAQYPDWQSFDVSDDDGHHFRRDAPMNQTTLTGVQTIAGLCSACCIFEPILTQAWTWSYLSPVPVTVGTEIVVIDRLHNRTSTTTKLITTSAVVTGVEYDRSAWETNGTFFPSTLLATKSISFRDLNGDTQTITYPTPFQQVGASQKWIGQLPYSGDGNTVCISNDGAGSPLPTPTSTPTPLPLAEIDKDDPSGIWWTIAPAHSPASMLDRSDISAMYDGGVVNAVAHSCASPAPLAPATAVNVASYLLDTSTSYGSVAAPATSQKPKVRPTSGTTTDSVLTPSSAPSVDDTFTATNQALKKSTSAANTLHSVNDLDPTGTTGFSLTSPPNVGEIIASAIGMSLPPSTPNIDSSSSESGTIYASVTRIVQNTRSVPIPIATAGSQTIVLDPSVSGVLVQASGTSLALVPGQHTTVAGTPISSGPGIVVVGSNTIDTRPGSSLEPLAVIGSEMIIANPSSAGVIVVQSGRSQVVGPGQQATIDSTPISVGSGIVIVGSSIVNIEPGLSQTAAAPLATIGPATIIANPSSAGVLIVQSTGTQTIAPGQQITIVNTPVLVGSSEIVIGSSTVNLTPASAARPLAIIGSETVIANPNGLGVIIIDSTSSQVLAPGGQATIDSTVISAGSSANVVGSRTIDVASPPLATSADAIPLATIGANTIETNPTSAGIIIVDGSSSRVLTPGQQATIDGTVISAGTSVALVGSRTIMVAPADPSNPAGLRPLATIGADTIEANPASAGIIIVDGTTSRVLAPGQQATIYGTVVSAGTSVVLVGSRTVMAAPSGPSGSSFSAMLLATVGTDTIEAIPSSSGVVVVDGTSSQVLTPGQVVTLNGTPVSVGSTAVVIGSSTLPLSSTSPTNIGPGSIQGSGDQTTGIASAAPSRGDGARIVTSSQLCTFALTVVLLLLA